ncbi:MAG: methyltransferase domain-containing protein [Pyrinomonadaceae bacterium]|nr:methyltransferase domain-containing protein [Pyrinomonadaceae bacterium]MCX7640662.1 methyltransferase domain-containing protein [Pyrinomonadaceae bacterium]MDW8305061.1 methyltransferase domain-containing protein [Acidobacteriota bacterium]
MEVSAKAPEKLHQIVFDEYQKKVPKGAKVIDLGAGEGAFAQKAILRGDLVVGVDRENWKIKAPFLSVNLDEVGFAESIVRDFGRFDVAIAIEIIEHLENPFAFIRECARLLKKDGLLFLTTPNVEAINSRVMFLIKGRLAYFDEYSTIRSAHITPVFSWKLDMALEEASFEKISDKYVLHEFTLGKHNIKGWLSGVLAAMLYPFVKGNKRGSNRVLIAKLK